MTQRSAHAKWLDVLQSVFAVFCVAYLFLYSVNFYFISLPVYTSGTILVIGFILVYVVWQGVVRKTKLPQTGLELPLLALIAVFIVSLLLSTNPRLGMQRVAQILFSVELFYVLLGVLQSEKAREKIRWAILWVSGVIIMFALLETYHLYYSWWMEVGSRRIMPPFPFRFFSIVGHSNIFMIIVNLCAPLALVSLMKARGRAARFGSIFWLVIYLLATLFSNSRSGWMGAAVWMFTFAALFVSDPHNRALMLNKIRKNNFKILVPFAMMASTGLLVCLFFLYQFFAGSHPSHGSSTALNREWIWKAALVLVKSSPWVGTGPGQVIHKLIPASKSSPFGWWPGHAHSTPLQILAEVGVLGFLSFAILLGIIIYQARNTLKLVQKHEQLWVWASIAAIAGIFVEGLFEDVTSVYFALFLIPFHVASILYFQQPARPLPQISLAWLAAPLLVAACITGVNIWAYLPYHQALNQMDRNDLASAARLFEQSAQRDPSQAWYTNQAGLTWSVIWKESGDPLALENARRLLAKTTEVDPGNSMEWANLAVLDWQAGERERALANIRTAMKLSPSEPSFWLNHAYFLEQLGREEEAVQEYERVIASDPFVAAHPFWSSSPLRQQALRNAEELAGELAEPSEWMLAREAIMKGDLASARYHLATSRLYKEPSPTYLAGWADLAKQAGQDALMRRRLENVMAGVEATYWGNNLYLFQYRFSILPIGIVPGYLKMIENGGQFEALAELVQEQIKDGDCQAAEHTWEVLQRELRAGEWPPEGYPTAPACP